MLNTYLRYGVPSGLADTLVSLGISKTIIEKTSLKNLINKYGLLSHDVQFLKSCVKRKPIDCDTVQQLLENSNFTCCLCKGQKGSAYLIHHIEPYSISQDNSYYNLATLCPNDHDLAHREGNGLTLKITSEQIRKAKVNWEKTVQEQKVFKASINGEINEIEFLNIPRILELSKEIFKLIPQTEYTNQLIQKKLITNNGGLNIATISKSAANPANPLIFFGPHGSWLLSSHYFEIFKLILKNLNFLDLDTLLNQKSIAKGIVGQYCYYVGGLYSSKLPRPLTSDSEMMKFFFKRRLFVVEWLVDPQYFSSSSAKYRTSHRNVYIIYGKVRAVNIESVNGKRLIIVNLQTYCFGLPTESKFRTPDIAFQNEMQKLFEMNEDEGDFLYKEGEANAT